MINLSRLPCFGSRIFNNNLRFTSVFILFSFQGFKPFLESIYRLCCKGGPIIAVNYYLHPILIWCFATNNLETLCMPQPAITTPMMPYFVIVHRDRYLGIWYIKFTHHLPFAALHIARAKMIIGAAENKPIMNPVQNIVQSPFRPKAWLFHPSCHRRSVRLGRHGGNPCF